jgi:hypothetical protein
MTIKEIAELCGAKSEQTVKNWAHKIGDDPAKNWQGLAVKLAEAEKSGKDPADFTLDETLAIIGEGGGNKALASLLAENAMSKNALAVQGAQGVISLFTRLNDMLEHQSRLLDDPKKAAYEELEAFVQKNLEVDEKRIYTVPVWHLYNAYCKTTEHPLSQHDLTFKIALDHPEFELKYRRKEWIFIRCKTIGII